MYRMINLSVLISGLLVLALACRVEAVKVAAVSDQTVAMSSRTVSCGCKLDEVGHCGNYIEIDDQFVEIANGSDLGLGVMEWCKVPSATAQAEGEVKDGKFIGTTLTSEG